MESTVNTWMVRSEAEAEFVVNALGRERLETVAADYIYDENLSAIELIEAVESGYDNETTLERHDPFQDLYYHVTYQAAVYRDTVEADEAGDEPSAVEQVVASEKAGETGAEVVWVDEADEDYEVAFEADETGADEDVSLVEKAVEVDSAGSEVVWEDGAEFPHICATFGTVEYTGAEVIW